MKIALFAAAALAFTVVPCQAVTAPADVAKQAVALLKPGAAVDRVEVQEVGARTFRYFVWFKRGQGDQGKARSETTKLIKRTLDQLVKDGVNPSEDFVRIHAAGVEPVKGETGKALVVDYGSAHYNFALDRIEFEATK